MLGTLSWLPYVHIEYQASGFNSGAPAGSLSAYILNQVSDPMVWIVFPGGGLVTALVYWILRKMTGEGDAAEGRPPA